MTTDVLKVPGDYKIIAKNGNVIFDLTGATTGTVQIFGNLDIIGQVSQIESVITVIDDPIITLNYGDPGTTITNGRSGIEVARDTNDPLRSATLLMDDTLTFTDDFGNTHVGVWDFQSELESAAIRTNFVRMDPANTSTLVLLGNGDNAYSVVSVRGTIDYELQVLHDDDIPNKKYVDSAFYAGTNLAKKLQVGNSFVEINDSSVPFSDPYYSPFDQIFAALGTSTNIVFKLEGNEALIQGLTISDNTIEVNSSSTNLILDPKPGNNVLITSPLSLQEQTTATIPTPVVNETVIYYQEPAGGGGTGLYFVNTVRSDELVSRRRAIIYGIIF